MHFEYDIFLSYKTSDEEVLGWIDNFKSHLSKVLSQLFNKDIKIITSKEISNSSEIMMTTGAFVSIVTKDYLSDSVENSYLSEFNKISQGKRIFKVTKENISSDSQTEILKQSVAYDFYHTDLSHNEKIDQDKFFKTEAERLYWLKVVDIAYAIYNTTVPEQSENKLKNISKSVFVAEVSSDQIKHRDTVMRELQYHGYNVLPFKTLPNNKIDFEQTVKDAVSEAKLSIHILGEKYGEKLPDSDISKVEFQNKIVTDVTKKTGIERLIWINPELKEFEDAQNVFLENLKKDIEELEGAELVQTPLEVFKTVVINKINSDSKRSSGSSDNGKSNAKSIYIINGQEDAENIKSLEDWVKSNGYEVINSDFDTKQGNLVEKHRQNLVDCDGAIVYYAHSNPQWIRMKMQDLVKAPGFGRTKPMNFTAVYSTLDEDLPQNNILSNFLYIKQNGDELNNDELKEITIKLS